MDFLFLHCIFTFLLNNQNIINNHLPSCSRCIHYQDFFSILLPVNNRFGKCSKFGEKNIITGKISYEYADDIRSDEDKCGNDGKLFEPRKFPYSILDKICEDKCNSEK